MTSSHVHDGEQEVLSLGPGAPRPRWRGSGWNGALRLSQRVWGAAICLALGALVGAQIDDALDARHAAEALDAAPPTLSAGVIQEYQDPDSDRIFAVPLYNGGSREVTVDSASADGWVPRGTESRAVAIPPHTWAMFPLPFQVDCDAIGADAPGSLTVKATTARGTFEQRLPMPLPSRVLGDAGWRLCLDPDGTVPTAQDLDGFWIVEEAGRSRGTVVRLGQDGTFAIDPDVLAFGADLDAVGTFTLAGGKLHLVAGGGGDCRPGDRTTWIVTLLVDGRLHIRHRAQGASWCGIDDGEVWVARRIGEPLSTRSR